MFAAFSVARLRLVHGERDLRSTIRDNLQYLFNETLSGPFKQSSCLFAATRTQFTNKARLNGETRGSRKKIRQWRTKHRSSEYSNWIGAFYDCCQLCRAFEHLLLDVSGWEHPPERALRVESYSAMSETLTNKLIDFPITSWRIYEALTQPTLRQTFNDISSTTGRSYFVPDFASLLRGLILAENNEKAFAIGLRATEKNPRSKLIARLPFSSLGSSVRASFCSRTLFLLLALITDDLLIHVKAALWHDNKMKKSSWEPAWELSGL